MLNLHAILPRSRANGPGVRFAVWFQGCSLQCPGCFNPDTHPFEPRLSVTPGELVERLAHEQTDIEGITISGGEPFEQADGLLALVAGIKERTGLSVILFSGYALPEVEAMPLGRDILSCVDVLLAGRYDSTCRIAHGLRGSANQTIHLLTSRYTLADIQSTPDAEVILNPDGSASTSGISPPG